MKIRTLADLDNKTVKNIIESLTPLPGMELILLQLRIHLLKKETLSDEKREKFLQKLGAKYREIEDNYGSDLEMEVANLRQLINFLDLDVEEEVIRHHLYLEEEIDDESTEDALDLPEDRFYGYTIAPTLHEKGIEPKRVVCVVCKKSGLAMRPHFFCSNECLHIGSTAEDDDVRVAYRKQLKADNYPLAKQITRKPYSFSRAENTYEFTKTDYTPNAFNPVIPVKLSDIVGAEWNCPYTQEVFERLSADEQYAPLLSEFHEICTELDLDFTGPGNSFERKFIQLLNRRYFREDKRIENDIETALANNPTIHDRALELLNALDEQAATYRYRKLTPGQLERFEENQYQYGMSMQSDFLNAEGIERTLHSFENCWFEGKEYMGRMVFVLGED